VNILEFRPPKENTIVSSLAVLVGLLLEEHDIDGRYPRLFDDHLEGRASSL